MLTRVNEWRAMSQLIVVSSYKLFICCVTLSLCRFIRHTFQQNNYTRMSVKTSIIGKIRTVMSEVQLITRWHQQWRNAARWHRQLNWYNNVDAECRRASIRDSDSRQNEQSLETARRKTQRQDNNIGQRELSLDTARCKILRKDDDVQQEKVAHTARKQRLCDSTWVWSLIHRFHSIVAHGQVYICSSCDQLLYRHSVLLAANICSMSLSITDSALVMKLNTFV